MPIDWKKLGEGMDKKIEREKRLGPAVWRYRCTRNVGCKDMEYTMRLPAHMLTCSCDRGYHDDKKCHGRPCREPIILVARNANAVETDQEDGIT